ncbi:MAG: hypothetical protein ACPG47_06925 [Leucothrix sp.]
MPLQWNRTKCWLCLPFILVFLCDGSITLYGQSTAYWAGDYTLANESFPAFNWALQQHPMVFVAQSLCWVTVFCLLILTLPDFVSEVMSFALVQGHTWGVMTWLVYSLQLNYYLCLLYFLGIAVVLVYSFRRWVDAKTARE